MNNYPDEEWKEVDLSNYCPKNRHWISNYGRAKKTYRNRDNKVFLYTPPIRTDGYKVIIVKMLDGTSKNYALHRLIAEYFIPKKREEEKYVNHIDFNKENNAVANLKWATHHENFKHCRQSKKWIESCKNNTFGAKLTETKVRVMKKLLNHPTNPTKVKIVAKQFGVSVSQAQRIKKGLRWKYVKSGWEDYVDK